MTKTAPTPRTWPAPLLAGLGHAALMLLAAPPLNAWPLVFVAVVPLAWLLVRGTARPWRDALLAMVGVAPMWMVWEWWTIDVTSLGFVPLVLVQSMWVAVFLLIAWRLHRRFPRVPMGLLVPVLWTAVEFFRGELFLDGYAWGLLAHPLIALTALASPAALLGAYFVSFLVAAVNGALADLIFVPRRVGAGRTILAVCAAVWIAGAMSLPPIDPAAPKVRPGIVQTNVPQSNKTGWSIQQQLEDWKRFERLTVDVAGVEDASRQRPDMIIWPETMMPGGTLEPDALEKLRQEQIRFMPEPGSGGGPVWATAFADRLLQVQPELGIPMLVGSEAYVNLKIEPTQHGVRIEPERRYNSVYLVDSGKIQNVRYDKVRLTPFGETMPYIRYWPWLQERMLQFGAGGMAFDLDFGKNLTVFDVPAASLGQTVRVVTPICFEITISGHCRNLVFDRGTRRAGLIVSVTNDGWFGNSDIDREQHLDAARWRAVELATPVARAANTGISAFIDAHGRLLARGVEGNARGVRADGVLIADVPLGTRTTLFARVGNVFPWSMLGLGVFALIGSFVRKKVRAD